MLTIRLLAFTAALALMIPAFKQSSHDQSSKPKDAPTNSRAIAQESSFSGCYELDVGRWWPWGFGADISYFTVPHRIQLLRERGTRGFEVGELLIRTIPRIDPPIDSRESSFWQLRSATRIDLMWTNGFVGVSLSLTKDGDRLSGWAHPHADAGMFIPRAEHVTARRISCGISLPKGW